MKKPSVLALASAVLLAGAVTASAQDVRYNFGDHDANVRPYFLGGAGVTHYGSVPFTVAGFSGETGGETQFSTTWALGVKLYPNPKVGLNLGVRWTPTYIKSDSEGWWCDPYWGCYVVGNAQ